MTIHATAIVVHGCKVHLEPTGPEPSDAEQRLRHEVSVVSSADNCLRGILSGMTTVPKPPKKCQRCGETIEGGAFVIVSDGVMHHECFAEALSTANKIAEKPADSPADMRLVASAMSYNRTKPEPAAKHLLLSAASQIDRLEKETSRLGDRVVDMTQAHADAVGECHELRAEVERLNRAASENGKSCLQLHDEGKRLRASMQAMAEQSATYMRERDEARQMHRERVFYDRASLEQQLADMGARLLRFREAAQRCLEMRPGEWMQPKLDELRKAMA